VTGLPFHDVRMRGFRERADLADAQAWCDARPALPRRESVPLDGAAGRVLAQDVVSAVDVPTFARAAMDGWAVRGADTFGASESDVVSLAVLGTALPGQPRADAVGPRQAVRIMTGAPLPPGSDAVLPAEQGEERAGRVQVREPVAPQKHVGATGEDVRAGDTVLRAGRRLRPQDVGLAASIGLATLAVHAKPGVSILATGDELAPVGTAPRGAQVADSNTPMLRALVERDGGRLVEARHVPDGEASVRAALQAATGDVVLVSGGSSVGIEDHAPRLLSELGTLAFHGLALRPASPAGCGLLGARPVFLLPGNPVSCLCAYDLLAARVVRRFAGLPPDPPYPVRVLPLARKIVSALGRVDYVRVRIVADRVEPVMTRGAAILSSTTEADGFVLVPRDLEGWPEGADVPVHLY
jgi:molybdopterin molybdotransferase